MEGWISFILLMAMAAGLYVGGRSLFSNPTELFNFTKELLAALAPIVTTPESPEVRKKRQEVERRGGIWDHANKRERERNK